MRHDDTLMLVPDRVVVHDFQVALDHPGGLTTAVATPRVYFCLSPPEALPNEGCTVLHSCGPLKVCLSLLQTGRRCECTGTPTRTYYIQASPSAPPNNIAVLLASYLLFLASLSYSLSNLQASPLSPQQTTRSFSTLLLSLQPHQPQHLTKRETIYPLASSTESIRSEPLLQFRPLRFNFCPTTCSAGALALYTIVKAARKQPRWQRCESKTGTNGKRTWLADAKTSRQHADNVSTAYWQ